MLARNEKGFALLIEGSQIDWACHNNDSAYLRAEMADFEQVLHTVLDFAVRDGNTLVVVTADHETGGVTLPDGEPYGCDGACVCVRAGSAAFFGNT